LASVLLVALLLGLAHVSIISRGDLTGKSPYGLLCSLRKENACGVFFSFARYAEPVLLRKTSGSIPGEEITNLNNPPYG